MVVAGSVQKLDTWIILFNANKTMNVYTSGLRLPRSSTTFRTSRVVLGLIFATLALAALLAYSTFENINRAQSVMEGFLRDKSETIIRSLEAGSRIYRMHHTGEDNPLHTFILENGKAEGIVFIRLSGLDGTILFQTGDSSAASRQDEQSHLLPSLHRHTQNINDPGVYVMTRVFKLGPSVPAMPMMHAPTPDLPTAESATGEVLISIGLSTRQFEAARKQDQHHTLFMAALLSLVGAAGIYFIFLYHRMWLTKASLADMKLYADSVFASIPVGLITLDRENRVVSCNRKSEEILGRSSDSLCGAGLEEIFPGDGPTFEELCTGGLDHDAQCVGADGGDRAGCHQWFQPRQS